MASRSRAWTPGLQGAARPESERMDRCWVSRTHEAGPRGVCVCVCVCVYGTSAERGQAGGNWVSLQSFQHKGNPLLCFLFFFFLLDIPLLLIGGSLLCSVVSVSAVRPQASAIHIHTSPCPWTSLPPSPLPSPRSSQGPSLSSLCSSPTSHPLGHHRAPR